MDDSFFLKEWKETRDKIDEVKTIINSKFEDQQKFLITNFVRSKTFYWILGFVIAGIISLTAFTGALRNDISIINEKHRIEESQQQKQGTSYKNDVVIGQ